MSVDDRDDGFNRIGRSESRECAGDKRGEKEKGGGDYKAVNDVLDVRMGVGVGVVDA